MLVSGSVSSVGHGLLESRSCGYSSLCPLPPTNTAPRGSFTPSPEQPPQFSPWHLGRSVVRSSTHSQACHQRGPGCLSANEGNSCLEGRTCQCLLTPLIFAFDHQLSHSKGQDAALGDGYGLLVVYGSLGSDNEDL